MELKNKAITEKKKRTRGIAAAVFFGCVACAALALTILNIMPHRYIYVLLYAFACILSTVYTVMKINTLSASFIGNDSSFVYMRSWENGFFPFRTDKGFFGEFLPDKVTTAEFALNEIKSIYIGTAGFISRNLPDSEFARKTKAYKEKYSSTMHRMEFIHITATDEKEYYMSVSDFDPGALAKIVRDAQVSNKNMTFLTGNRKIRRQLPENNMRFGI